MHEIRETNRGFDTPFTGRMREGWQQSSWNPPLDVAGTSEEYIVKASLPGINPEDLDITFINNTLTIKAELKGDGEDRGFEQAQYHVREHRYGRFSRSLSLPSNIEGDNIQANYENGVLIVHLPKAEQLEERVRLSGVPPEAPSKGQAGAQVFDSPE